MSFQKKSWEPYCLTIDDGVLRRDADLVPLLIAMHDAAVEWWQANPRKGLALSDYRNHYFHAVNEAGLGAVADYVSSIQRARSREPLKL